MYNRNGGKYFLICLHFYVNLLISSFALRYKLGVNRKPRPQFIQHYKDKDSCLSYIIFIIVIDKKICDKIPSIIVVFHVIIINSTFDKKFYENIFILIFNNLFNILECITQALILHK